MLTGEERKESMIDSWDEEFYEAQSSMKATEKNKNSMEMQNSMRELKSSIYKEPFHEELKN